MNMPEIDHDCPELIEKTADAIDDSILQGLFVSTQMNNLSGNQFSNGHFKTSTVSRYVWHLVTCG